MKIRHDEMSPRPSSLNYAALQGTKGAYEALRHHKDTHRVCLDEPGADPRHREWRPLSDFESDHLPDCWRGRSEEDDMHGGSDGLTLTAFVDCVLNDEPSPIDAYRALDFTVPGLMSEVSVAQAGARVAVPDFRLM